LLTWEYPYEEVTERITTPTAATIEEVIHVARLAGLLLEAIPQILVTV
jgi:hypothetical protein